MATQKLETDVVFVGGGSAGLCGSRLMYVLERAAEIQPLLLFFYHIALSK